MPNDPIEQKIWNAILSKLTTAQASGLLTYVSASSIMEGIRENIPSGAFPVIVLEPDTSEELEHTTPNRNRSVFRVNITCAIEHMDLDKQILGDGTTRGIVDIVNDVKNVLQADTKLGLAADGVLWIRFPSTRWFVDNYPMREAVITTEVTYTHTITGR